jgi:threonyl-tRNA synthetase
VQIDLNLPERFDVTFVNEKGERERAVMIHRVLFGSLERFVGGLIEHYAGNFPLWLNWEQVAVIPVRESALEYARELTKKLRAENFRVHLDEQAGDLRNRVKEAQQRKANYMLVVGDKEAAAGTVSVRRRGSRDEERGVTLDAFVDRIKKERQSKALPSDFAQHEPTVGDAIA